MKEYVVYGFDDPQMFQAVHEEVYSNKRDALNGLNEARDRFPYSLLILRQYDQWGGVEWEEEIHTHGGKREGAGRPKGTRNAIAVNWRVNEETRDWVRETAEQAGIKTGEVVDELVRLFREQENLLVSK